jgi:hypothetical protein
MMILYNFDKMNLQDNNKINGIPDGVSYGQFDREEDLNKRINGRQFPDSPLEPNFDLRPLSTKYTKFSVLDKEVKKQNKNEFSNHRLSGNFNPGTSRAPVSGYFSNIDLESSMRNQLFALQHGIPQNTYIPTSESELYKVHVVSNDTTPQPHANLFHKSDFDKSLHPNLHMTNIGSDKFFNHTRTQLRDTE